jgi:LysR family glycine cleavage system transcriptional activator
MSTGVAWNRSRPRPHWHPKMTTPARPAIPSTTALRVFEAAARHLTCTSAADELFMTQSAVSKQIRALEDSLGVTLFVRLNRGLVLTELGSRYLEDIRPGLAILRLASEKIAQSGVSRRTLTLRVSAIVGDRWLLPRFADFAHRHPEIGVQFTGFLSTDKQERVEPDGEFCASEGLRPGFSADYLFGRSLVLVAAPALLRRHGDIQRAADIQGFPKLTYFKAPRTWAEFCETRGLPAPDTGRMTRYEFYSTLISGAVSGLGLALVPRVWVHDELARGLLVNPLALGHSHAMGYHFVYPERKRHDPSLAALRAWLIDQASQTRREHRDLESERAMAGPAQA